MASFNKCIFLGRLGKDIELKTGQSSGATFADLSVVTDEYDGKDDAGKTKYKGVWHQCRAFKATAEFAAKYGKKGMDILVESAHESNTVNKDGVDTTYHTFKVNSVAFPGIRKTDNAEGSTDTSQPAASSTGTSTSTAGAVQSATPAVNQGAEELPF